MKLSQQLLESSSVTISDRVDRQSSSAAIPAADFTSYPGGKSVSGVPQWICNILPSHVFYAEPFAGHGAIFRNKPPSLRSTLIDMDEVVITWWHRQIQRGSIDCVDAVHGCGLDWLETEIVRTNPELLVYLDPPYLLETRVKKKIYRFEMTDRDHRRMLSAAKRLSGPVVISGYRSEMYLEELSGWSLHTRWVTTRGTPREEFLWCNRPPATSSPLSMEYSARGGNFRERQRVSRKVSRWGSDFAKLPDYERRSILLNLMEIENRLTSIPHRHD